MESQLRQNCQSLLKQLKMSQQMLNSEIAAHVNIGDTACETLKLGKTIPETVNLSENNDNHLLKSAHARNKLISAAKPLSEDHLNVKIANSSKNDVKNKENIYRKNGEGALLQGENGDLQSSSKSSHLFNNVESRPTLRTIPRENSKKQTFVVDDNEDVTSSSWQPATPNTQRRRKLIDRHTEVPTRLDAKELRDLNNERRLNFSYSQIDPDGGIPHLSHEHKDVSQSCINPEDRVKLPKISEKLTHQSQSTVTQVDNADAEFTKEGADFNAAQGKACGGSRTSTGCDRQTFTKQLEDDGNNRKLNSFIRDTTIKPKSLLNSTCYSLHNLSASRRNNTSVRFDTSRNTQDSLPDQRLLGYDWIAALLDNDSHLMDQSESFFNELREFRRAYKDECSNQFYREGPHTLVDFEPEPVAEALREPKVEPYVVNDRLFAEPLRPGLIDYDDDGSGSRPHRGSRKEPTADNPRFVRVSVPMSTLQSPHRVRPHRRRSFDASDSCSLMSHCLLGWENVLPTMIPTAKSLDLKTEAGTHSDYQKTTLAEAEKLASMYSYAQWPFSKPTPRIQLLPLWKKHYMDTTLNMSIPTATSINSSISRTSAGTESIKRATDKLLNSAYANMYEMERLKEERRLESLMRGGGKAGEFDERRREGWRV